MRVAIIFYSDGARPYAEKLWQGLRSFAVEAQVFDYDDWEHQVSLYGATALVLVSNRLGDEVETFRWAYRLPKLPFVYLYADGYVVPKFEKNIALANWFYVKDGIELFYRVLCPVRTSVDP